MEKEQQPNILQEAEELIYGERQAEYGSVTENYERIAKVWSGILSHDVTAREVLLCMVGLKAVREATNPKRDNIVDCAGYAGCIDKLNNNL